VGGATNVYQPSLFPSVGTLLYQTVRDLVDQRRQSAAESSDAIAIISTQPEGALQRQVNGTVTHTAFNDSTCANGGVRDATADRDVELILLYFMEGDVDGDIRGLAVVDRDIGPPGHHDA
jgi:hypothetical protein